MKQQYIVTVPSLIIGAKQYFNGQPVTLDDAEFEANKTALKPAIAPDLKTKETLKNG